MSRFSVLRLTFGLGILFGLAQAAGAQEVRFKIPGSTLSLAVECRPSHPFLAEHARHLVLRSGDTLLAQEYLYPDSGQGSLANLYQAHEGKFVLVDMNGYWFETSPRDQKIKVSEWRWETPAPGKYLGCFTWKQEAKKRVWGFFPPEVMTEQNVHRIKDPDRHAPGVPNSDPKTPAIKPAR